MYSYFSKGRNKNYLYGCGAPDYEDEVEVENEMGVDSSEMAEMSPQERQEIYIEHQREEGKI